MQIGMISVVLSIFDLKGQNNLKKKSSRLNYYDNNRRDIIILKTITIQ